MKAVNKCFCKLTALMRKRIEVLAVESAFVSDKQAYMQYQSLTELNKPFYVLSRGFNAFDTKEYISKFNILLY